MKLFYISSIFEKHLCWKYNSKWAVILSRDFKDVVLLSSSVHHCFLKKKLIGSILDALKLVAIYIFSF
jgi:hypothetical protein